MNSYSFSHTITPRPGSNDSLLIDVLNGLLTRYLERVPDANRVVQLFQVREDKIINDHIAFRSIHIESMLRIFIHLGYEVKMNHITNKPFNFESKKLTAVWLKHPNLDVPRVFISQFRFDEGSERLQNIVNHYLSDWTDPIASLNLDDANAINTYLHTAQWETPTYEHYCDLQQESEYVSWVLYNKYYLNHFTLSVHSLHSFDFMSELDQVVKNYHDSYMKQQSSSVITDGINMMKKKYQKHFKEFNDFLQANDFTMNMISNNNVMNISPDGCLLQSSTKSNMIQATFPEGVFQIPGSYVEFAYRGFTEDVIKKAIVTGDSLLSLGISARRDGFETSNANKIFESTYMGKEISAESKVSSYEISCKRITEFLNNLTD